MMSGDDVPRPGDRVALGHSYNRVVALHGAAHARQVGLAPWWGVGLGGSMAETEPALPHTSETATRKPLPWWWLCGPLLVVAVLVSGQFGWDAWKHHQFEKERTETPPLVVPDLKLKLLWIPAGTFTMGTEDEVPWLKSVKKKYNDLKPAGWTGWKWKEVLEDQTPVTVVTLSKGFYLGETEVTQAQWEAVMGSNPSHFKGPSRPVEQVSWDDCVLFCQKLTQRERAAGRLGPKQVLRLPTEAEREYACRAGSRSEFCFGNDESKLGLYAWYEGNSGGETHEVGTKRANAWGVSDMHGNAWEWCADGYGPYPGGFVTDPTGSTVRALRVVRGGSWVNRARGCRSAFRGGYESDVRGDDLGLRLAAGQEP